MLIEQFIFILHFVAKRFICGTTSKEKELDCPNPESFEYESSQFYHNSYPFRSYDSVMIRNFDSFGNIKLECFNHIYPIGSLTLIPCQYLILNNNLRFDNCSIFSQQIIFKFSYIKSFGFDLKTFDSFKKYSISLYFMFTHFLFDNDTGQISPFQNFNEIFFLPNCKYYRATSPGIFKNSKIKLLRIHGFSDTIIKKNILEFNTNKIGLEANIETLELGFYRFSLQSRLLNPNIFENISFLTLSGRLDSIDDNVLKKYYRLEKLVFSSENVIYTLKKGFLFLNSLDFKERIGKTAFFQIFDYYFPDEDFCFFKNFPRNNSILVEVPYRPFECSCLYLWLVDLYFKSSSSISIQDFCFNFKQKTCNFDLVLKKCDKKIFKVKNLNEIDQLYLTEIINFFMIFLFPFIGIVSLATNFINILVLKKMNLNSHFSIKINKILLYEWMLFNSFLNLMYSFIYSFHHLNVCVFNNLSFCSILSRSIPVQYFEIYVIDFFGNTLKTLSNIFSLLISIQRFNILTNRSFFNCYLDNTKSRFCMFFILIILSFFFNLDKFLTSEINANYSNFVDFYQEFPNRNTFKGLFDQENRPQFRNIFFKQKNPFYFILFCINFIINDVLLIIIICFIDILMILRFKKDMEIKKKLLTTHQEKKMIADIYIIRTMVIIILNISILLVTRGLEFSINSFIFYQNISNGVCNTINKVCSNYYNYGNVLFLISSSFTTVVYFWTNKGFRSTLKSIIRLKL